MTNGSNKGYYYYYYYYINSNQEQTAADLSLTFLTQLYNFK